MFHNKLPSLVDYEVGVQLQTSPSPWLEGHWLEHDLSDGGVGWELKTCFSEKVRSALMRIERVPLSLCHQMNIMIVTACRGCS